MAKTIMLIGFASAPSPAALKKFLEEAAGEGTVCGVIVGKTERSKAHAVVEFTTTEAAEHIKSLVAASYLQALDVEPNTRICLSPAAVKEFVEEHSGEGTVFEVEVVKIESSRAYSTAEFEAIEAAAHIKSLDVEPNTMISQHRIDNVTLNVGCQISKEKFSVLWSQENVSVKFGSDLRKFNFFLTYNGVEYKLEVSYESIWEIELRHPHGQTSKFLVIQLYGAPRIYEKDGKQCIREVDFTPSSSIGQSSALCLKLPGRGHVPKFLRDFFYYKESEEKFTLEKGSSFSCNSELVPIINPPKNIRLPFKILFKINLLVQHGCIPGTSLDKRFFHFVDPTKINIAYIEHALEKLFHLRVPCYDPVSWLKLQYKTYSKSSTPPQISLDDGLVYVRKIMITPSKIYFCGPEAILSNRVLRTYPNDIDNFLRVSFVDEDGEKLFATVLSPRTSSSNDEERRTGIYRRILSILRNGIEIGGKKFETLAFSNSQLKENSLWMFASRPGLTAADIREGMGDFSDIKNVAKFAARLGQSFGSSKEALHVDSSEVEIIPDVETKSGGKKYVFSDGIGKISSELAQIAARRWGCTNYTPSAFQIRYAGYKGVVAVDPTSTVKLSLRNSMSKYKSSSTSLDVLAVSKYQPCFLNRQLITLMSTLGVGDPIFQRKQREAVAQLDEILTDPVKALEALEFMVSSKESTRVVKEMLLCGYKPDEEPFLSMMLQTFRASHLQELRSRTRIFVQNGQAMMGTLDETGTLEYGQVFVQYSGSKCHHSDNRSPVFSGSGSGQYNIVEGKVVVAKNPCLHPGDMRVLKAVDVPALHHMVDCIVFPAKGKRPHTDECSGSDLDGDIYFVCWDPDLIPPRQSPPMDYTPAPPKVSENDVTIEDIEEYFADYIVNDSLGIICNAHVVFADREPKQAKSAACKELARLASIAVDFSKTGVAAEIPRCLRPKKYPDFMEKQNQLTYKSQRVLGKLYRQVKDIAPATAAMKSFTKEVAILSYDPAMQVEGFEKYIDKAFYYKTQYDSKLGNLMDYYGIKTEAEILSGCIMKMARFFDKKRDMDEISFAVRSLRKQARAWFNLTDRESSDSAKQVYAKASAWYHVTYHHTYWDRYNQGMHQDHFLSFAWCVYDKLVEIKKGNLGT